jgi:hypothetical protein
MINEKKRNIRVVVLYCIEWRCKIGFVTKNVKKSKIFVFFSNDLNFLIAINSFNSTTNQQLLVIIC